MAQPIIEFVNVGFRYRAQKELTLIDINLSIYEGEKILIAGPSGSGKSTLAHCINGLIPFNYSGELTGVLRMAGHDTREMSIFELSKLVGTVLQDPDGQFVSLTAGEDIAFSLENNCVPLPEMQKRVSAAASLVGIEKRLDASPYDLSGGQKQRVSIAGVVVDEVKILLFDEPLANLDPASGKQTIALIDDLARDSNTTVIIIEHRLEDALYRSVDRVILIDEGRIVADTPPDKLFCGSLLQEVGIREPLYVTALKYASVPVFPENRPGRLNTLSLNDDAKDALRRWAANPVLAAAERGDAVLSVEGLGFEYERGKPVLRDVGFEVFSGEMTAIVGTNGAGKSTLAKLICGFEKPSSGKIHLRGAEGDSISERAKHVGYVMQNPNQMISKTMIFDEVAFGLRIRKVPEDEVKRRVDETLAVCGLSPFVNWPISALSFGQKKRVTIASVLVLRPAILLLDEPTAGQDFRHYTEIMEFLLTLTATGVSVLMITHDMHLMLEYATRVLVFDGGRLLEDSTAAKVLTDPEIVRSASLKETSLYTLAGNCGLTDIAGFVQYFIQYDRERRTHG